MIEELINQLAEDEGTVKNDNDRHIVYKCPAGKVYCRIWNRS